MLLKLEQRASAFTFGHLFVPLPSLCLGVCLLCAHLSAHLSTVYSVGFVCVGHISVLFKLLLSFEMYSNIVRV